MKLEEGMIVRLNTAHGKHKKGTLYKIKEVCGALAFAKCLDMDLNLTLYRFSTLVEVVEKGGFYV